MDAAFCTFLDTALGRCAIAWRGERVAAFALAGEEDRSTIAALRGKGAGAQPAEPPAWVRAIIAEIRALLDGADVDLSGVPVDLDAVPPFERTIYGLLRTVKRGETVTYGELAVRAGQPGAARAVGMAMGRNPIPVIIPCHRVLAGSGRGGGFSAAGGIATKFRLLQIERAGRYGDGLLFDDLPLAVRS